MNLTDKIKHCAQGLLAATVLLVGGMPTHGASAQDDCCRPGAACCYPGSPCCAGHAHAAPKRVR